MVTLALLVDLVHRAEVISLDHVVRELETQFPNEQVVASNQLRGKVVRRKIYALRNKKTLLRSVQIIPHDTQTLSCGSRLQTSLYNFSYMEIGAQCGLSLRDSERKEIHTDTVECLPIIAQPHLLKR